jgi:hypothetical protein
MIRYKDGIAPIIGGVLLIAIGLALNGCGASSPATVATNVQGAVSSMASKVEAACVDANTAATDAKPFAAVPAVSDIISFVTAGCSTADAIAALTVKAVDDPTTVAWAESLATDLKNAVAEIKKL